MTAIGTAPAPATAEQLPAQPVLARYRGTVRHRRPAPGARDFAPRLSLTYVDVDALPGALDPIPLWSARRPAPVHFRRRDFLDRCDRPLGEAVRDLVAAQLGRRPAGTVHLLAHLRTFGWLHNPLAAYYCHDRAGALDALVLEVTNTPWGERHHYVFDARDGRTEGRAAKAMHVSPFLPMDADYRMSWTAPGTRLTLRITVEHAERPVFDACLALRREPLDRRAALVGFVRDPLPTLRVSIGIYLRAARLFLAGVPLYRHPGRRRRRPDGTHVRNGDHG